MPAISLSKDKINAMALLLLDTHSIEYAAYIVGISRHTYYKYANDAKLLLSGTLDPTWTDEYVELLQYFAEKVFEARAFAEENLKREMLMAARVKQDWRGFQAVGKLMFQWWRDETNIQGQIVDGQAVEDQEKIRKQLRGKSTAELEAELARQNNEDMDILDLDVS